MGNQNMDTGKNPDKNLQNPGQNPNTKNPQQGQNAGRQQQQQGFDKNRNQQNPSQGGGQRASGIDEDTEEETSEKSEKEDLYGNRKDAGTNPQQNR